MFRVKETTGLDTLSCILTGILILLLTLQSIAAFIESFRPKKSQEQYMIEHVINILYCNGALTTISSALTAMNHPDAELFNDAYITLSYTREDNTINHWIIKAIVTLSSNINNHIDSINIDNVTNISEYINENYATDDGESSDVEDESSDVDDDESGVEDDESSGVESTENDKVEDESDAESGEMPESTSPVRMARALTHYSNDTSSRKESSTNDECSNDIVTPNNTPHQSDVESSVNSDNSSESENSATGEDLSPENPVTIGDSVPSEPINETNESKTDSVEQSGNSENTSENS
jgi:hypothetical protein